jgi:hypothetical protein
MLAIISNQKTSVGHPLWNRNLKASTNGFTRIAFSFDHVQGLLNLKLQSRPMPRLPYYVSGCPGASDHSTEHQDEHPSSAPLGDDLSERHFITLSRVAICVSEKEGWYLESSPRTFGP